MPGASRKLIVWAAAIMLAGPAIAESGGPSQKEVLARAGRRVLQYQADLPHLVATETSVQLATAPCGALLEASERHLVSEFGWVSAGDSPDLVGVRDVIQVDGHALRDIDRSRLQMLMHESGAITVDTVTQLLNEGARFNLAEGSRNFNLPTVALFFLHPETQPRFKWSRSSLPEAPTWVMSFKERALPTIIKTGDGEPVFSKGSVEIETATGQVRRTELTIHVDKLEYTLTTTFGRVESVNMILPLRLSEKYVTPSGTISGEATYDSYRRFETTARLLQ